MGEEGFPALRASLEKFSSCKMPDNIKTACKTCADCLKPENIVIPFSDKDNNFLDSLSFIFKNEYNIKIYSSLIDPLIKLISDHKFCNPLSVQIIQIIIDCYDQIEIDCSISLVQYLSEAISKCMPNYEIIRKYFSLLFNLINSYNPIISSTAIASFQLFFMNFIKVIQDTKPSAKSEEFLASASEDLKMKFYSDSEALYQILFRIFQDMTEIALCHPTTYITIRVKTIVSIFDLLEMAISASSDIINSNPNIGMLLQGTIIQLIDNPDALRFITVFIESTYQSHPSLCKSVVVEYTSQISPKNKKSILPLFFFHYMFLNGTVNPVDLYAAFDDGDELAANILRALHQFIKARVPTEAVDLYFKPIKSPTMCNESFIWTAPFEIVFSMVNALAESENASSIVISAGMELLNICIISITYLTPSSLETALDSLFGMLRMIVQYLPSDANESIIRVCDFDGIILKNINTSGLQIEAKRAMWPPFLCDLIADTEVICKNRWSLIIQTVFPTLDVTPPPTFAHALELKEKMEILESLINVSPMPFGFIADFLVAEKDEFKQLWLKIDGFLMLQFSSSGTRESTEDSVALFVSILQTSFSADTESYILGTARKLLGTDCELGSDSKSLILSELRTIIQQYASQIRNGWDDLLEGISPSNYKGQPEALSAASAILNIICNDCISYFSSEELRDCVSLIFAYANQNVDFNISLSSLDLLWVVSRALRQTSKLWTQVFEGVLDLVTDERDLLTTTAVSYVFNLLSSNISQLPPAIVNSMINDELPKCIQKLDENNPKLYSAIKAFGQECSHFIVGFWSLCNTMEKFRENLLYRLIAKITSFSMVCPVQEIVSNVFEFYETFFAFDNLDSETELRLISALEEMAIAFQKFKDPNALILATCGRMFGNVIKLSSPRMRTGKSSVDHFFKLLRIVSIDRYRFTDHLVHMLVQRTYEGVSKLAPLPSDQTKLLVKELVDIALECKDPPLIPIICQNLCDIFDEVEGDSKLQFFAICKPMFAFPESESLKQILADAKIEPSDPSLHFTCLAASGATSIELLDLLPDVEPEIMKGFLLRNESDFNLLKKIWFRYICEFSHEYDSRVADALYDTFIELLKRRKFESPQEAIDFLNFIDESNDMKVMLSSFGVISSLVTSESIEVRTIVQDIVLKIEMITHNLLKL